MDYYRHFNNRNKDAKCRLLNSLKFKKPPKS